MSNLTAKSLTNSIVITSTSGATLTIENVNGVLYRTTSEMEQKDYQYSLNIFKFVSEWTTKHVNTKQPWKQRFSDMAKTINGLKNVNTFRGLSTSLRRAYDNGKSLSHADFQKKFFYEGKMNVPTV